MSIRSAFASTTRPPLPLQGVDPQFRLHGLAELGSGGLALGAQLELGSRGRDYILTATVSGGEVRAKNALPLDYSGWDSAAPSGRGIRGLCSSKGALWVLTDLSVDHPDGNFAPIARYDLKAKTWSYERALLPDPTFRLSGLSFRETADSVQMITVAKARRPGLPGKAKNRERWIATLQPTDDAKRWTLELRVDVNAALGSSHEAQDLAWLSDQSVLLGVNSSSRSAGGEGYLVQVSFPARGRPARSMDLR